MSVSFNHLKKGDVAIFGLPFDDFSSFLKGPSKAPKLILEALHNGSMNLSSESGADLGSEGCLQEIGNLEGIKHPRDVIDPIDEILATGASAIALGGDHSLTYGVVKAFSQHYENMTLLHLDAHPDLNDEFDGNRYSHACPFARIMEENLVGRLVQVGIRTMTPHQQEQAQKFGVEVIEMKNWSADIDLKLEGPVFMSFDIDVLDPAFAPGISHHEPGGMSTREAIDFINHQKMNLIGADIMEYNPDRDLNGVTAMVCAKLLKEIAGKIIANFP